MVKYDYIHERAKTRPYISIPNIDNQTAQIVGIVTLSTLYALIESRSVDGSRSKG